MLFSLHFYLLFIILFYFIKMLTSALQEITTAMLMQDVITLMGVLRAVVILGTLVKESAVKVNTGKNLTIIT